LIVGITGTLGAGKGTIVSLLAGRLGFAHYSVRDYLTHEIQRRRMPVNRDTMVEVANELRAAHTPSYLVERLHEQALAAGGDCVIESLRTPGEVEALRGRGSFVLLAVDARPELRYERIRRRGSSTDGVSFEHFLADEEREMRSEDPNHQNLSRCIGMADHVFRNDGTIDELYERVEKTIEHIRHEQARQAH